MGIWLSNVNFRNSVACSGELKDEIKGTVSIAVYSNPVTDWCPAGSWGQGTGEGKNEG